MSEKDIAQKIRELREKHSLTLEDVAKSVGVGKSTVRKWETGIIENMRRDKIAKLAAALHTSPAYLMGWDDEPEYVPNNLFTPLKRLRESLNLSAEQVSDGAKIPLGTYLAVENGHNTDCITLAKLAAFFNCSADFILSFDGVFSEDEIIENARFHFARTGLSSALHDRLSDDEIELIQLYRNLNNIGQTTARDMLRSLHNTHPGENAIPTPKEA